MQNPEISFVRRWRATRAAGRTTRRLSESFGSQQPAVGEKLDRRLAKVERLLSRREKLPVPSDPEGPDELDRIDARVTRLLDQADLSLELLRTLERELA